MEKPENTAFGRRSLLHPLHALQHVPIRHSSAATHPTSSSGMSTSPTSPATYLPHPCGHKSPQGGFIENNLLGYLLTQARSLAGRILPSNRGHQPCGSP